jgi:hypothetical protein
MLYLLPMNFAPPLSFVSRQMNADREVHMKSSMRAIRTLLFVLVVSGCAVPPGTSGTQTVLEPLPFSNQFAELDLGPVIQRLNPDESGVQTRYGWFCLPAGKRYFSSDQPAIPRASLEQAMRSALQPLNYKLRPRVGSVFASDSPSRLYLGGTITAVRANVCHPFSGTASLVAGNPGLAKGTVFVDVSWELYDNAEKRVVFSTAVQGSFETAETIDGGVSALLLRATTNNFANLAALPDFRKAVMSVLPQSAAPRVSSNL